MERRFESRLDEMLEQAHVSPDLLRGVLPRLEEFIEPVVDHLPGPDHRRHAVEYVTGLMSKLERKTGEGIAYLLDQQGIQKVIGDVPWAAARSADEERPGSIPGFLPPLLPVCYPFGPKYPLAMSANDMRCTLLQLLEIALK